MRFSVFLARHRRLLPAGLASLLLHLLAIAWVDARLAPPAVTVGNPALALRLVDAPPAAPAPQTPDLPAPEVPAPDAAPVPAVDAPADEVSVPAPAPMAEPPPPETEGDVATTRVPNTYRVTPPPSGRIDYRLTRSAPGGAPQDAGQASMAWRSDGNRYTVALDGVLGTLASDGRVDDAGIAPDRARRAVGTGQATTTFDRAAGTIMRAQGGADQLVPGSQDPASLLLQLAGIGLGDARQVKDELEFWVGGAGGAGVERYQVLGPERIETGAGPLDTVRLARMAEHGAPLLELWLAPQHAWMPVQLRLTDADGTVSTQTLAAIAIEAVQEE
ncbi:DUF3108 domain-containing protein [Massilia sp. CFBP9026]|nr:DUF3108 domain-containing protein [Massilia sp. CFBP9026]MDY0960932.1 DUF3108 domain-containing protein [Massilia sp. CFBP9026]